MTNLAAALVAAQKQMPAVDKTGVNPHFRSEFVTLDHLLAAVRPVLNDHGIAVAQFPSANEAGQPTLTTVLLHESGDKLEYSMPLFLPKQDPQGQGSAITYARRYALQAALGISTEKDDDGEAASHGSLQGGAAAGGGGDSGAKPEGSAATAAANKAQAAQPKRDNTPAGHVHAGDVVIGFGKNAEKRISDLSPKQIGWYAGDPVPEGSTVKPFVPGDDPHKDLVLRAAQAYRADKDAVIQESAADLEIPF